MSHESKDWVSQCLAHSMFTVNIYLLTELPIPSSLHLPTCKMGSISSELGGERCPPLASLQEDIAGALHCPTTPRPLCVFSLLPPLLKGMLGCQQEIKGGFVLHKPTQGTCCLHLSGLLGERRLLTRLSPVTLLCLPGCLQDRSALPGEKEQNAAGRWGREGSRDVTKSLPEASSGSTM